MPDLSVINLFSSLTSWWMNTHLLELLRSAWARRLIYSSQGFAQPGFSGCISHKSMLEEEEWIVIRITLQVTRDIVLQIIGNEVLFVS